MFEHGTSASHGIFSVDAEDNYCVRVKSSRLRIIAPSH